MDNNNYVYIILRKEDSKTLGAGVAPAGSPIYVGISSDKRRFRRLSRGTLTFEHCQIHKYAEGLTREEAEDLERELIARFGRLNTGTGILRNLTDGGDKGPRGQVMSPETREKMSKAQRGKNNPMYGRRGKDAPGFGVSMTPERKAHLIAVKSRQWYVKTPDGTVLSVTNLNQFCRDSGLDQGHMTNVANGKRKYCKGYKAWPATPLNEIRAYVEPPARELHTLICPLGIPISFWNAKQFCEENGLCRSQIHRVLQGKQGSHRGYRIGRCN